MGTGITSVINGSPYGGVTTVEKDSVHVIDVDIRENGTAAIKSGTRVATVSAQVGTVATGGVMFEGNDFPTVVEINGPVIIRGDAQSLCSRHGGVAVFPFEVSAEEDAPVRRANVGPIFSGNEVRLAADVTVGGNVVAVGNIYGEPGVEVKGRLFSLEGGVGDVFPGSKTVANLETTRSGNAVIYTDGEIRRQESGIRIENASVVITRDVTDGTMMLVANYHPEQDTHSINANIQRGHIRFEQGSVRKYAEFNGRDFTDFEQTCANWRPLNATAYTLGVSELPAVATRDLTAGQTSGVRAVTEIDSALAAIAAGLPSEIAAVRAAIGGAAGDSARTTIPRPDSAEANALCEAAFAAAQGTGEARTLGDIQRTYRLAYLATLSGSSSDDLQRVGALDGGARIAEMAQRAGNAPEYAAVVASAFGQAADRLVTAREEASRTQGNTVVTSRGSTISHS